MVYDCDRENQLSGCAARVQHGRKNINGSGVVITVALEWGSFFGALTSLGLLAKEVRVEGFTVLGQKSASIAVFRAKPVLFTLV